MGALSVKGHLRSKVRNLWEIDILADKRNATMPVAARKRHRQHNGRARVERDRWAVLMDSAPILVGTARQCMAELITWLEMDRSNWSRLQVQKWVDKP